MRTLTVLSSRLPKAVNPLRSIEALDRRQLSRSQIFVLFALTACGIFALLLDQTIETINYEL